MVNRGRSGACITCKQRRVKCDEAKPKCQTCHRLGLRCDGYQTRYSNLKFRDQNYKFRGVRPTPVASDENRVSRPRALGAPDTSVSFFLQYYVGMGRDLGSARGFYEVLTPVYYSQTQESPLSLAVSAVASEVLSLWRGDPTCASQEMYTRAITRLRSTLQDRKNWGDPATLLAVLSLQMYENVAAVFDLRSGTSVHHDGALSLLPFAGSSPSDALTWTHLQRFILHSEICSALRQERPSHRIVSSWVEGEYSIAPSENPSPRLDAIGAAVAELQARFMQCSKQNVQMQNAPRDWRIEAKRIDRQLLAWAKSLPDYWRPLKLLSGQEIDRSIPTYQSVAEVYPTCQIGNVWNLWRVQRLLLLRVIFGSLTTLPPQNVELPDDGIPNRTEDIREYLHTLQELVDSVCHSVPFYLGNRYNPMNLADFSDTEIWLPSYQSLASGDERILGSQYQEFQTSKDDYRRHILAQGPWHIMSPLSRLLTLFSEGHGQLMASFLRPGQYEWICEQFSRVTFLLRIPVSGPRGVKSPSPLPTSPWQGSTSSEVEYLAKEVRKGAIFMSGP